MEIVTNDPIAFYSKDTTEPKGAAHDNTKNPNFVARLSERFGGRKLTFLDMGCAGGGIVKDMIDGGHQGYGVEGCDFQKVNQSGEWPNIPFNLFNADITKPFHFTHGGAQVKFDLISAWDVMEHIPEEKLEGLCQNLVNNLKDDGLFVCGIATFEDEGYHVCLHEQPWWEETFAKYGLVVAEPLNNYARDCSFHLTLKKA